MTAGSEWSNQPVIAPVVIIFGPAGTFTGLFIYDPSPGTGTLRESAASTTGTDPYANAYDAGFTSYQGQNSTSLMTSMQAGGLIVTTYGRIGTTPIIRSDGGNGTEMWLHGASGAQVAPFLRLLPTAIVVDSPGIYAAQPGSSPVTAEVWHNFTGTANLTVDFARYRMTPMNEVEIDFHGTTTSTTGVIIGNLPSGPPSYIPALTPRHYAIGYTGTITTTSPLRLFVSVTGQVSLAGAWTSGATVGGTVTIPLD